MLSITKLQNLKAIHNYATYRYCDTLLLSIRKLQNLKAIHNQSQFQAQLSGVVINHKTTKFESNSQPWWGCVQRTRRCYQSQNYKIWKQFTTGLLPKYWYPQDVINHKTTKFESNSQHAWNDKKAGIRCYQSQNYKIWKQFTTRTSKKSIWGTMLSIIKLQNLKAIHNKASGAYRLSSDVINHKTTKFESNSQLASVRILSLLRCYQSQNYKIWKQFTTFFA